MSFHDVPPENKDAPQAVPPAPEPIDQFKALTTCAIDNIAAMKAAGEGFMLCALVKQVPDLAIPGPDEPPGERVQIGVCVHIGGKIKFPPKIALLAALQKIFAELRGLNKELQLTPQDIGQILGVEVKGQSRIVLPGDPRLMGGRRMS